MNNVTTKSSSVPKSVDDYVQPVNPAIRDSIYVLNGKLLDIKEQLQMVLNRTNASIDLIEGDADNVLGPCKTDGCDEQAGSTNRVPTKNLAELISLVGTDLNYIHVLLDEILSRQDVVLRDLMN